VSKRLFRYLPLLGAIGFFLWVTALIGEYEPQEISSPSQGSALIHHGVRSLSPQNASSNASANAAEAADVIVAGSLRAGETFSQALTRHQVDDSTAAQVIRGLGQVLNFRRCRPGESFCLSLDPSGRLIRCTYEKGPFDVWALEPDPSEEGEGCRVFKETVVLDCHIVKMSGVITDSIAKAFADAGADIRLTVAFAEIFASHIDFNTEPQPGDRFDLVVEEYFKGTSFVGYGPILGARYQGSDRELEAYFFKPDPETPGRYFDASGQELGTHFLKSPLPVYRITSRFTNRRLHPVYHVIRPHHGVDLAAPTGTPVMAAADGKVQFAGWKNGFGRTVILQHHGGYRTYYGHLSRFGKGIRKGALVSQKQTIGYVGSTGVATGPHLDYRIQENGVFRNPFSLKFQPKSRLSEDSLNAFSETRAAYLEILESQEPCREVFIETREVQGPPDGWLG